MAHPTHITPVAHLESLRRQFAALEAHLDRGHRSLSPGVKGALEALHRAIERLTTEPATHP